MAVPERQSILLVEDEVGIREAFALLLELEGYVVHMAVDGQDALDVLARATVDLVVTDYMMPRMDGLALARALRQRVDPPPVVLVTAAAGAPEPTGDVAVVLAKPFDLGVLVDTVARLLREHGAGP